LTYFSYDANMNKRKYFPKENIEREDAVLNECPGDRLGFRNTIKCQSGDLS
jgi:hypothetical protein